MKESLTHYFERPGLETYPLQPDENGWHNGVVIRSSSPSNYVTTFKCQAAAFDDDTFWESIQSKLQNLLYNRINFPADKIFQNKEELIAFINAHHPRLSPQEKLDSVLDYLRQQTTYDGEGLYIDLLAWDSDEVFRKFFMASPGELRFYINVLKENGDVSFGDTDVNELYLNITLKGLNKLIAFDEKKNSRVCFVAMSFSKELETVYNNAIAPAITATGFLPLLLRDEQVDADKTINDAILAGLKKAKFTLADFTGHRVNVYFEAGYALGRGQKVIYSCREDQVEQAGFDTRNFQHLVWKDEDDFRKKLSNKIQAYIVD